MQKTLIIYCHPWNQSFNHAVLEHVKYNLESNHNNYKVIDLYTDGFNPAYDQEELRLFHSGQTHDPLVKEYLTDLKQATNLIIISPVWWNDLPAILKGFIDKVMKEGPDLTHVVTPTGIKGLLTNLNSAYVFTSSTSPTFYLKLFCGNAIKRVFIDSTLKQIGVKKTKWNNFGKISTSKKADCLKYLKKIDTLKLTF